jgi:hypothetical protein
VIQASKAGGRNRRGRGCCLLCDSTDTKHCQAQHGETTRGKPLMLPDTTVNFQWHSHHLSRRVRNMHKLFFTDVPFFNRSKWNIATFDS